MRAKVTISETAEQKLREVRHSNLTIELHGLRWQHLTIELHGLRWQHLTIELHGLRRQSKGYDK